MSAQQEWLNLRPHQFSVDLDTSVNRWDNHRVLFFGKNAAYCKGKDPINYSVINDDMWKIHVESKNWDA